MNDVPIQLIVAAFNEEKAADQALEALKQAKKEKLIGILDAAVIRRDEKNKLHLKETADVGGGKGALVGGALGAVLGLIAGPAGLLVGAAAGALTGGVAGKAIDAGIPDDRLKEIGEALKPGTSAIVAIIEHRWVAEIENELAAAGAQVMTEALKADIAAQLEAGKDVAYTAIASDEGMLVASTVTDAKAEATAEQPKPEAGTTETKPEAGAEEQK
jgi:uncharacterized membrane protein